MSGLLNDVWSSPDAGVSWISQGLAAFSPRFYAATLVIGDTLFLAGGYPAAESIMDMWSTTDGMTWTEMIFDASVAPEPRYTHTLAYFAGQMQMFGGRGILIADPLNDVWGLTVNSLVGASTWSRFGNAPGAANIWGQGAMHQGDMVMFGSEGSVDVLLWHGGSSFTRRSDLSPPLFPIYYPALVSTGTEFLVLGGRYVWSDTFFNTVFTSVKPPSPLPPSPSSTGPINSSSSGSQSSASGVEGVVVRSSLAGWSIALIVIGSLLVLCLLAWAWRYRRGHRDFKEDEKHERHLAAPLKQADIEGGGRGAREGAGAAMVAGGACSASATSSGSAAQYAFLPAAAAADGITRTEREDANKRMRRKTYSERMAPDEVDEPPAGAAAVVGEESAPMVFGAAASGGAAAAAALVAARGWNSRKNNSNEPVGPVRVSYEPRGVTPIAPYDNNQQHDARAGANGSEGRSLQPPLGPTPPRRRASGSEQFVDKVALSAVEEEEAAAAFPVPSAPLFDSNANLQMQQQQQQRQQRQVSPPLELAAVLVDSPAPGETNSFIREEPFHPNPAAMDDVRSFQYTLGDDVLSAPASVSASIGTTVGAKDQYKLAEGQWSTDSSSNYSSASSQEGQVVGWPSALPQKQSQSQQQRPDGTAVGGAHPGAGVLEPKSNYSYDYD